MILLRIGGEMRERFVRLPADRIPDFGGFRAAAAVSEAGATAGKLPRYPLLTVVDGLDTGRTTVKATICREINR